jgi:hypothetical protein
LYISAAEENALKRSTGLCQGEVAIVLRDWFLSLSSELISEVQAKLVLLKGEVDTMMMAMQSMMVALGVEVVAGDQRVLLRRNDGDYIHTVSKGACYVLP